MALSYVNYTAGGSDTDYTITFAYLSPDYVDVYLDGVLKTLTTDYTYFNATTIRFNSTVGAGVLVLLKRDTLDTSRVVDFQDAGNLTEADLDNSADQLFHLQQEVLDDVTDNSMQLNASNEWDAESHKIINLSDPTLAQDAVTKTWAETAMSSELTQAIAAKDAAVVAQTAAELAETNAETAETAAELAETNAETAETGAAADLVLTNADVVSTNADVVTTTADVATTNADAATTTQDAIDTAADVVSTNADAVLTAADVVLCNAAYDAFDDRYLGAKASDPTLDNDGNALLTGALYFNSTSDQMKVYSGASWDVVPGLVNVVDDTTPQLGGDLDVNGSDIVSVSDGDINLLPDGTGEVTVASERVLTVGDMQAVLQASWYALTASYVEMTDLAFTGLPVGVYLVEYGLRTTRDTGSGASAPDCEVRWTNGRMLGIPESYDGSAATYDATGPVDNSPTFAQTGGTTTGSSANHVDAELCYTNALFEVTSASGTLTLFAKYTGAVSVANAAALHEGSFIILRRLS